jgi:hypothetical protein
MRRRRLAEGCCGNKGDERDGCWPDRAIHCCSQPSPRNRRWQEGTVRFSCRWPNPDHLGLEATPDAIVAAAVEAEARGFDGIGQLYGALCAGSGARGTTCRTLRSSPNPVPRDIARRRRTGYVSSAYLCRRTRFGRIVHADFSRSGCPT